MKRTFGFWGLLALTTVLAIGPELWPATAEGQSRARRTAPPSRSDAEEERSTRRKPRGRVPRFYGKVGLSDKQRESIYTIQGRYRKQIAELMQQLNEIPAVAGVHLMAPGNFAGIPGAIEQSGLRKVRKEFA